METIGLSNSFKLSDHLQIGDGSTNAFDAVYITSDVGLDDYDLVRVKIGLNAYNSQGGHDGRISMFVSSTTPPPMDYTQWLAETNAETVYNPNNRYLSIPNVNSGYPGIGWGWNYYTQKYDIVEWWLE